MSNTITAYFKGRVGVAESVYQNDYGIVMAFDSIDLPAHFDCYFSRLNQEEALPGLGADNRVTIPNSILANPGNVTIHIPLHTGEDDSEVEYVIYFKVIGRARPIDDGTPTQMTAIERALALLSQPITNIEEIVNEALSFTGDTFAEMKQELADDFAEYKGDVDDNIADFKTEIRGDIADVEHDFTILQGQFDTAVAAVTTDTEVTDIRVGDDGVTYTTAGVAARTQFRNIKDDVIGNIKLNTTDKTSEYVHAYMDQEISFVGTTLTKTYKRIINVVKGCTYKISVINSASPSHVGNIGSAITDTDDIVKQMFNIASAAGQTSVVTVKAVTDGYLYITVENNAEVMIEGSLVYDVKKDIKELQIVKPVSTITSDMFEKGAWDNKNKTAYRQDNRARTNTLYYALNDFDIYPKHPIGNAVIMAFTYDNQLNYKEYKSWASTIHINKGDVFNLSLSSTNSGTAPSLTLNEVLDLFCFVSSPITVREDFDPDEWSVIVGAIGNTNLIYGNDGIHLSILDYFKAKDALLRLTIAASHSAWVIGYDKDFNIIHPYTDYGTLVGTLYLDVSDCAYVRFILHGSVGITPSDISNLDLSWNVPKSIEYPNEGQMLSISKDGINNDGGTYAPQYPKSSIVSFQKAYDQGFRALMLHVQFTSDDVAVVFHDEKINNWAVNSDGTTIGTNVFINDSTLAELNTYDFGLKFGSQYEGTKITELSDALLFCKNRGMKVVIEPPSTLSTAHNKAVCDMIKSYGLQGNCAYHSYKLSVLQQIHTELEYADLLWTPSDGEAFFMSHFNDFLALKGINDLWLFGGLDYSEENLATIIDSGKIRFLQSPDGVVEPYSIISRLNTYPVVSGMVSQIVPAYSALQSE